MKGFLAIFLFSTQLLFAASSSVFVAVKNKTFNITTPLKFTEQISLNVENQTDIDYFMKLENEEKVIKLFTLKAKKTYSLDFKNYKGKLKIIPLSPPYKTIPLDRENQSYEISKI